MIVHIEEPSSGVCCHCMAGCRIEVHTDVHNTRGAQLRALCQVWVDMKGTAVIQHACTSQLLRAW